MTPKPMTVERLALRQESWRLHFIGGQTYTEIAMMQGRSRQIAAMDGSAYGKEQGFDDRAAAREGCCERCGIIRDKSRLPNCDNPNSDVLCDDCHEELVAGTFWSDELLPERLIKLGYDPGPRGRLVQRIYDAWEIGG